MTSEIAAVLSTLQRVQRFINDHAASLDTLPASGSRHALDDVTDELRRYAVDQEASKRVGLANTAAIRVLSNKLTHNHMRAIARIAQASLRNVPEFAALKMPPSHTTPRRLIAAAGAMIQAATPYAQTFIAGGTAANFLDQLQAAANALDASLGNRGATAGVGVGATQGLDTAASRGRKILRAVSAMIEPRIATDEALFAEWLSAKRITGRRTKIGVTATDAAVVAETVDAPVPMRLVAPAVMALPVAALPVMPVSPILDKVEAAQVTVY